MLRTLPNFDLMPVNLAVAERPCRATLPSDLAERPCRVTLPSHLAKQRCHMPFPPALAKPCETPCAQGIKMGRLVRSTPPIR